MQMKHRQGFTFPFVSDACCTMHVSDGLGWARTGAFEGETYLGDLLVSVGRGAPPPAIKLPTGHIFSKEGIQTLTLILMRARTHMCDSN